MLKSPVIVTGPATVPSSIVSCLLFEFPGSPLTLVEGAVYEFASALAQQDVLGHLVPIPSLEGLHPESLQLIAVGFICRDVVQLFRICPKVEQQIRITAAGDEFQ